MDEERHFGGYPPPVGGPIGMLMPIAADQLADCPVRPAIGAAAEVLYSDTSWRPVTVLGWARFRGSWAVLIRWPDGSQDWRAYDGRSLRPASGGAAADQRQDRPRDQQKDRPEN